MQDLLVIGSLAYDSVTTLSGKTEKALGGAANYFSIAASLFAQVKVVGIVGSDYRQIDRDILLQRKVNIDGIKSVEGLTFHWEGSYEKNLNEAETYKTELNVFADFKPVVPDAYKQTSHVFLANMDPLSQLQVLSQIEKPIFVGMDTMNYWIMSKRDELLKVISKVDIVFMNETEAKMLSNEKNLYKALRNISSLGPKYIVIKKGEYGSMLYSKDDGFFNCPALIVEEVIDPTGAGDSFAGGFFGYITKNVQGTPTWNDLKQAVVTGTVMSSQAIQNFSVKSLVELDLSRFNQLKKDLMQSMSL